MHSLVEEDGSWTNRHADYTLSFKGDESRNKSIFPFLQLPLELREFIYDYLLPDTDVPITEPDLIETHRLRQDGTTCCPALLSTCRQVYDELIGRFYGTATFAIYVEQHEISFLGTPSYVYSPKFPRNLQHVRKLHIEMQLPPIHVTFTQKSYLCIEQLVEYMVKNCQVLHTINVAFDICFLEGHVPRNRMEYYIQEPQGYIHQIVRPIFNWAMRPFKDLQRVKMITQTGLVWPRRIQGDQTTTGGRRVIQELLAEEAEIYCRKLLPEVFGLCERQRCGFEQDLLYIPHRPSG